MHLDLVIVFVWLCCLLLEYVRRAVLLDVHACISFSFSLDGNHRCWRTVCINNRMGYLKRLHTDLSNSTNSYGLSFDSCVTGTKVEPMQIDCGRILIEYEVTQYT